MFGKPSFFLLKKSNPPCILFQMSKLLYNSFEISKLLGNLFQNRKTFYTLFYGKEWKQKNIFLRCMQAKNKNQNFDAKLDAKGSSLQLNVITFTFLYMTCVTFSILDSYQNFGMQWLEFVHNKQNENHHQCKIFLSLKTCQTPQFVTVRIPATSRSRLILQF